MVSLLITIYLRGIKCNFISPRWTRDILNTAMVSLFITIYLRGIKCNFINREWTWDILNTVMVSLLITTVKSRQLEPRITRTLELKLNPLALILLHNLPPITRTFVNSNYFFIPLDVRVKVSLLYLLTGNKVPLYFTEMISRFFISLRWSEKTNNSIACRVVIKTLN